MPVLKMSFSATLTVAPYFIVLFNKLIRKSIEPAKSIIVVVES
jgi:hypothetical protein